MPQRILIKVVDKFDVERMSASKSQETYAEDRCVGSQEQSYKCDSLNESSHPNKPPVNNSCLYRGGDSIVMVVGGPNKRIDHRFLTKPSNNRDNDSYYRSTARNDNNFKLSNSHGSNNRVMTRMDRRTRLQQQWQRFLLRNRETRIIRMVPMTRAIHTARGTPATMLTVPATAVPTPMGRETRITFSCGCNNRGNDSYGSRNDNDNNGTSSYGSNSERDPGSYGLKNEYDNNSKPYGSSQSSMKSYIDKGVAYAAQKAGYSVNTSEKIGDVIPGKLGIEGGLLILPQASGDGVVIGQ
ncbi:hypothetical protein EV361DRAFT_981703 [Lentinula raphanica]|nr:hypothetical protein EV361DRAFT_981703 [Lentinula raphanica]